MSSPDGAEPLPSGEVDAFSILLQQRTTVPDRSISGNLVPCASNPVPCSGYAPTIEVEDGATLVVGAPEDCADCYPDDPAYLTEL